MVARDGVIKMVNRILSVILDRKVSKLLDRRSSPEKRKFLSSSRCVLIVVLGHGIIGKLSTRLKCSVCPVALVK
jgi:hypothetical protein